MNGVENYFICKDAKMHKLWNGSVEIIIIYDISSNEFEGSITNMRLATRVKVQQLHSGQEYSNHHCIIRFKAEYCLSALYTQSHETARELVDEPTIS